MPQNLQVDTDGLRLSSASSRESPPRWPSAPSVRVVTRPVTSVSAPSMSRSNQFATSSRLAWDDTRTMWKPAASHMTAPMAMALGTSQGRC